MNEYPSSRSRIICFIISLIIHLILLFLLWVTWPEYLEIGSSDQQTTSSEAIVIQPYAGTANPAMVFFQPPPQPLPAHPVPQAITQTTIVASTDDSADTTTQESPAAEESSHVSEVPHEDTATALPLRQAESAPYYAAPQQQKKSRRKKKKHQQQSPGIAGLSFASLINKKASMPPISPVFGGSSSGDIARNLYATKVQNFISKAINIEGVRLLLSRTFTKAVVFQTSINRDGTIIDFHLEPCDTPELKVVEEEVRKIILAAGLFPAIPRSIPNDCCTIPYALHVVGSKGEGSYKVMQK